MKILSGKISKNKVSFDEMRRHKSLNSYEDVCDCHAESIEECTCGKFKKVGADED